MWNWKAWRYKNLASQERNYYKRLERLSFGPLRKSSMNSQLVYDSNRITYDQLWNGDGISCFYLMWKLTASNSRKKDSYSSMFKKNKAEVHITILFLDFWILFSCSDNMYLGEFQTKEDLGTWNHSKNIKPLYVVENWNGIRLLNLPC